MTCVDAGVVDLRSLGCLPKHDSLTLDDQSFATLDEVDDATLGRLRRLAVKPVALSHDATSHILQWTTPWVEGAVLRRLDGLETLELEVKLSDPSVLQNLSSLRGLKLGQRVADPEVFARLHHLTELNVGEMNNLAPRSSATRPTGDRGIDRPHVDARRDEVGGNVVRGAARVGVAPSAATRPRRAIMASTSLMARS